ncbi:hypothetical protein RhiirA4_450439 [Rhizophagus irregularis]|uniref:Uncharacterized protein n=1 Tax=Rhizophagus irregularis TaxID=588596 RepID=A0A2I1FT72_9GLOM|nr:hypothetical protein RhiirA4_450439 [Rhizophagus irregularis]
MPNQWTPPLTEWTLDEATNNSQRFLEIKPGKDYKPCIWCINYSLQFGRQERFMCTPAGERPLSSSSGSIWKCDSETRALGVRELLGDECLDLFMPVETRSPNQNDREFHEFHKSTDEWLIDQENKEYFKKTYGITNIHPLFVDHYGMTVLFLDDRGILFAWCEMTKDMDILRINKMEGLANYLYHPEKVCAIMEDTGELVPRLELKRRVKERGQRRSWKRKSWRRKIGKKGWQRKGKSDMGVSL